MGIKASMEKDLKKEKKKDSKWQFGFLGAKGNAYKEAQDALNAEDKPIASNDYEKE